MKELSALKADLKEKKAIFNEYRIINGPVTKESVLSKINDKKSSIKIDVVSSTTTDDQHIEIDDISSTTTDTPSSKTELSFSQKIKNVLFGK